MAAAGCACLQRWATGHELLLCGGLVVVQMMREEDEKATAQSA